MMNSAIFSVMVKNVWNMVVKQVNLKYGYRIKYVGNSYDSKK